MFYISNLQFSIIVILLFLIIGYCIFSYPYVFNQVDMIHYRIKRIEEKKETIIKSEENQTIKTIKKVVIYTINQLFSNIIFMINHFITINNKTQQYIYSIIKDFIIYI